MLSHVNHHPPLAASTRISLHSTAATSNANQAKAMAIQHWQHTTGPKTRKQKLQSGHRNSSSNSSSGLVVVASALEVLLWQKECRPNGFHSLLHDVEAVADHGLPRPGQVGSPLPLQRGLLLCQLPCSATQLVHCLHSDMVLLSLFQTNKQLYCGPNSQVT